MVSDGLIDKEKATYCEELIEFMKKRKRCFYQSDVMNRTTIISELENIKDKVITYEESVARFKEANKKLEEVKNYEPRRLIEFDDKYFPKYVESKIGKKSYPKEFAYFDLRRFSKKQQPIGTLKSKSIIV